MGIYGILASLVARFAQWGAGHLPARLLVTVFNLLSQLLAAVATVMEQVVVDAPTE